jgi:hypothetical protein
MPGGVTLFCPASPKFLRCKRSRIGGNHACESLGAQSSQATPSRSMIVVHRHLKPAMPTGHAMNLRPQATSNPSGAHAHNILWLNTSPVVTSGMPFLMLISFSSPVITHAFHIHKRCARRVGIAAIGFEQSRRSGVSLRCTHLPFPRESGLQTRSRTIRNVGARRSPVAHPVGVQEGPG